MKEQFIVKLLWLTSEDRYIVILELEIVVLFV